MKVRKAEIEDKEQIVELFIQMQGLHCKNRPDIFKEKTKKETEKEFDETIENKNARIFYERIGGELFKERKIPIGDKEYDEVCYKYKL